MKFLIVQCLIFISFGASAHQPDLSSTVLMEKNNEWILQVRGSLTGFEYVIENHYGDSAYTSPEEFQALVVEYIKENVSILFNKENDITLESGLVQLGHETSVSFKLIGALKNIESLVIKNTSFSSISHNKSILVVLKKGFPRDKFVLNNKNSHTANLKVNGDKFEMITPMPSKANHYLFIVIGLLGALSALYYFFKNKTLEQATVTPVNV